MPSRPHAPQLVIEWTPWFGTFLRNFADLFRPEEPPLYLSSKPAPYWPDVFVNRRLPAMPFVQSYSAHVALVLIVWTITFAYLTQPKVTQNPQNNEKLTYYDVSEYLPPLSSGSAPAPQAQRGDPEYAKQPIVSMPPKPDNRMQTIVDPMHPQILDHDVKMPNIVVWTPIPAPPVPAAVRGAPQQLPQLAKDIAPPSVQKEKLADLKLPSVPAASVIAPPPAADTLQRKIGDITIGIPNTVAQPQLIVPVQRASAVADANAAKTNDAPPSTTVGSGSGAQAVGQLIALGLHPVQPTGPILMPGGNRRGEFAAGPNGHPGAAGTPDKACCGNGPGGSGNGNGGPGSGGNGSGVYVGAGPNNPGAGVQGDHPSNGAGGAPGGGTGNGNLKDLMAKAAAPARPDIPRGNGGADTGATGPTAPPDASRIEDYSFGPKKYYTMTINMPNLSSASGSWIIRFAELHQTRGTADLTAPEATLKVDPAYPPELMKQRVEGKVILYAVIHADGTVGEVRVVQGLDDQLDANAVRAIQRWRFRPATKNGSPVDLEAVVQVPFTVKKSPYGF